MSAWSMRRAFQYSSTASRYCSLAKNRSPRSRWRAFLASGDRALPPSREATGDCSRSSAAPAGLTGSVGAPSSPTGADRGADRRGPAPATAPSGPRRAGRRRAEASAEVLCSARLQTLGEGDGDAGRSGHRVMGRRTLLSVIAGGLLAAPLAAQAQQAGKIYRCHASSALGDGPFGRRVREGALCYLCAQNYDAPV